MKPFTKHDEIFMLASEMGCVPAWEPGMLGTAWHCTCEDNRHGCDSQCSAISLVRLRELRLKEPTHAV